MRVLFITNFYPPCEYGWGYMQLCEEVADGLHSRGHDVAILTSTHRHGSEKDRPYPIHRLLHIDPDWHNGKSAVWQFFFGRRHREKNAVAAFLNLVVEFHPDVIFIWHAIGLPRVLLKEAEHIPNVEVAYYMAGYLPELPDEFIAYWQAKPVRLAAKVLKRPLSRIALRMLAKEGKPIDLKYENVICVSDYVRHRLLSKGLIPDTSIVIHNGVDISKFTSKGSGDSLTHETLLCLIAGRVVPEKGIHTAIEAIAELRKNHISGITLTILGDGPMNYFQHLQSLVASHHLEEYVFFHPPVVRDQMPVVLAQFDALLLPSIYAEPIARSMQEAMAMGLLVIGTTTGGSGELLIHEKTGLVCAAEHPHSLASQLCHAIEEQEKALVWARSGQQRVRENFKLQQTVDRIEHYLVSLIG